jgi:hypothetical protein
MNIIVCSKDEKLSTQVKINDQILEEVQELIHLGGKTHQNLKSKK